MIMGKQAYTAVLPQTVMSSSAMSCHAMSCRALSTVTVTITVTVTVWWSTAGLHSCTTPKCRVQTNSCVWWQAGPCWQAVVLSGSTCSHWVMTLNVAHGATVQSHYSAPWCSAWNHQQACPGAASWISNPL